MSPRAFDDFCRASIDFLARANVPYLVVGGLAVAAVGEPRFTADLDVVAFVALEAAEGLIASAVGAGFTAAPDEPVRLRETGTLRFHRDLFQFDIVVASLPFEERALRRATLMDLFGRQVPMPTPEDLVLLKVISGREKDILDAVGIVRRHAARLDWQHVAQGIDEACALADQTGPREVLAEVRKRASRFGSAS